VSEYVQGREEEQQSDFVRFVGHVENRVQKIRFFSGRSFFCDV
jgi:hypothetical protein